MIDGPRATARVGGHRRAPGPERACVSPRTGADRRRSRVVFAGRERDRATPRPRRGDAEPRARRHLRTNDVAPRPRPQTACLTRSRRRSHAPRAPMAPDPSTAKSQGRHHAPRTPDAQRQKKPGCPSIAATIDHVARDPLLGAVARIRDLDIAVGDRHVSSDERWALLALKDTILPVLNRSRWRAFTALPTAPWTHQARSDQE